jgi:hypothetical protein
MVEPIGVLNLFYLCICKLVVRRQSLRGVVQITKALQSTVILSYLVDFSTSVQV